MIQLDVISLIQTTKPYLETTLGKKALSKAIGLSAPFSGSIGCKVVDIRDGYIETLLPDRRKVRNHIGTIHAGALATFADTTAAVTILHSMPSGRKPVATGLNMNFIKKAKGPITAKCEWDVPAADAQGIDLIVILTNAKGETVAEGKTVWRFLG